MAARTSAGRSTSSSRRASIVRHRCSCWAPSSAAALLVGRVGRVAASAASAAAACRREPSGPVAHTVFGTSWPVYHHDGLGSGADPTSTNLSPGAPAWTSAALDGQIFGEPLVQSGRVVVATENDTVDELAANTGAVLWSTHVGTAVPRGTSPAGTSRPTVGITGTPVIDAARGEVFAVTDEAAGAERPALPGGPRPLHRRRAAAPGHHVAGIGPAGRSSSGPGWRSTTATSSPASGGTTGTAATTTAGWSPIPEGGGAEQSFEVASNPG